jgi:hypothetical protein
MHVAQGTRRENQPAQEVGTVNGAMMLRQVDVAIDQFDLHVHQCRLCLTHGNLLCTEGTFRAEDVASAQAQIKRPMRGPVRGLDLLRRRPEAAPAAM